jgi:hypothetical protein
MPTIKPTFTKVEFRFEMEGAEPMALRYRSTHFIPQMATVTVDDGDGAGWRVCLAGPNAKKDGTPGANHHEQHHSQRWDKDIPDWARELAESCVQRYRDMLAEG